MTDLEKTLIEIQKTLSNLTARVEILEMKLKEINP
tara:strand:- start:256 stop:360 length:105 start_codon:yes stop_codon:yes gene_type:complete